jgi:hypothetical protein
VLVSAFQLVTRAPPAVERRLGPDECAEIERWARILAEQYSPRLEVAARLRRVNSLSKPHLVPVRQFVGTDALLVLSRHRSVGWGNPSAIEQRSETRGCIGSHLWRHVAVELERGLHAVVAKPLAHSLDVDALLKQ